MKAGINNIATDFAVNLFYADRLSAHSHPFSDATGYAAKSLSEKLFQIKSFSDRLFVKQDVVCCSIHSKGKPCWVLPFYLS